MWSKRRAEVSDGTTAVVFSRGRVEVARVRLRTGERPALLNWDSYALDGGELEGLKRLRGARQLGGRCTTLLHHGQYQMLQIEPPSVPAEELREAVRWRIKEMVDFPVDQAGVDVLRVPAAAPGRPAQAFAVAARNDVIGQQVRLFQDAKVDLAVIDVPELALRNVAALLEEENRGLAFLSFNADGGTLVFTFQGELYALRHIEVAAAQLAGSGEAMAAIHERVLLDVQRSLDNFDRNFSHISLPHLLVAPLPEAEAFVAYLRENLYLPVEVLDLATAMDLSAVPLLAETARQSEALLAIGAALRQEAA